MGTSKTPATWVASLQKAENKWIEIGGDDIQTIKKEMGFALQLVKANPELQNCDGESLYNAVMNVGRTGVTLNPILKLAYLIPRNKKVVLDFDYKGLVKILKDSGAVIDIRAYIVYADEQFEEKGQLNPHIHVIKHAKTEEEHKKREVLGVYSQAVVPGGHTIYTELMPYWEVLKAEAVSKSKDTSYSPWKNWRESMIKKTKLKADFKLFISDMPKAKRDLLTDALELEETNNGLQDQYVFKGNRRSSVSAAFDQDSEIFDAEVVDTPAQENQVEENQKFDVDMFKAETQLYGLPNKRTSPQIKVLASLFSKVSGDELEKGYDKAGISPYESIERFIQMASVEELVLMRQALKL